MRIFVFRHNINLEIGETDTKMHTTAVTTILARQRSLPWLVCVLDGFCGAFLLLLLLSHWVLRRYHQLFVSPAVILRYIHCDFYFFDFLFSVFLAFFLRLLSLAIAHWNAKEYIFYALLYSVWEIKKADGKKLYANWWNEKLVITGALAAEWMAKVWSVLLRVVRITDRFFKITRSISIPIFKRQNHATDSAYCSIPVVHLKASHNHSYGLYSQLVAI